MRASIRIEAAHGRHGESALVPWLLAFNEAVSSLPRGEYHAPRAGTSQRFAEDRHKGSNGPRQPLEDTCPTRVKHGP